MNRHAAFTLIELLVVITIIVVLLALLTPALEKAVYQAQLAVCGANLKGIANGAQVYAVENKRFYPHRTGFISPARGQPLDLIYDGQNNQGVIERTVPLDILNDPFVPAVDLGTRASSWIMGSYEMWFGFGYNGETHMRRIGDRFSFTQNPAGGSVTRRFDVIATDFDFYVDDATRRSISSHPDDLGAMASLVYQDRQSITFSRWENLDANGNGGNGIARGLVDLNYAFTDGSVERHNAVKVPRDDRMTTVPYLSDHLGYEVVRLQLPSP